MPLEARAAEGELGTVLVLGATGVAGTLAGRIMATIPSFMSRIANGEVSVPTAADPLDEIGAAWTDRTPGRRSVVTA